MAYYKCGKIFATQNSNTSIETASGAIANFNTSLAMPVLDCIAEFNASQAAGTPTPFAPIPIVGVDKVNFARTGKNLLPSLSSAVTVNQITFSPLSDGAIDIDGTASGNASVDVGRNEGCFLQAGTYYVNITATPYTITVFGIVNGTVATIKSGGGLFTLTKPTQIFVRVFIASGTSVNHLRLPLQLERGSTATDYEAYNGTTALINLGGTYYGGSVDAVTGKITKNYGYIEYDGSEDEVWSEQNGTYRIAAPSDWYFEDSQHSNVITCNMFIPDYRSRINNAIRRGQSNVVITSDAFTGLANFKQFISSTPIQVVYPLATPIVLYASNSAEIPTKSGLNNIFCDTGDIEIKYRRLHNDF